jgi:acyl-homoserine-lactone acylase
MLRLYGQARGRAAEYWGDAYTESDRYVRTMGIPTRAAEWVRGQSPEFTPLLNAFVAGVNAYGKEHATAIAPNMTQVLPISATDVLAHVQRVLNFTFVSNPQLIQGLADRWNRGSNAWAVAPQRTAEGHALLLANPHLPWGDLYTWFEAQISTPDVNAYGAALVATPFVGIAFNDVLGWSHTNNTMDGSDTYELQTTDAGYKWNDGVKAFEIHTETMKIRQADGSMKPQTLTIKQSIHGPVVSEKPGSALAVRVVGLDAPNVGDQYWKMIHAKSLPEFENAERALQNPFFTVMYADVAGHIMHLFGGRTPARPAGNYSWSTIVPGTSDATLWTRTHPYEELPKITDPASGWLQNANDPPWTTTFPTAIDPAKYPAYMAPRAMGLRPQRSANLLEQNPKMTFDQMVANKMSTRMELADRVLDDLLPPATAAGGAAAEAAAVLAQWDRCADADSKGAVLFEAWYRRAVRTAGAAGIFAKRWSEAEPRTTPDGLRDPATAVAALVAAANETRLLWGALDVAWGTIHRLRVGTLDLPANGGPGDLGIFRVVNYDNDPASTGPARKQIANGGDSYVAVIEFTPSGPKAMSLISYGNATQPGSAHVGDQLRLFAEKKLKPVWRTRAEIEAHLEKKETLRR